MSDEQPRFEGVDRLKDFRPAKIVSAGTDARKIHLGNVKKRRRLIKTREKREDLWSLPEEEIMELLGAVRNGFDVINQSKQNTKNELYDRMVSILNYEEGINDFLNEFRNMINSQNATISELRSQSGTELKLLNYERELDTASVHYDAYFEAYNEFLELKEKYISLYQTYDDDFDQNDFDPLDTGKLEDFENASLIAASKLDDAEMEFFDDIDKINILETQMDKTFDKFKKVDAIRQSIDPDENLRTPPTAPLKRPNAFDPNDVELAMDAVDDVRAITSAVYPSAQKKMRDSFSNDRQIKKMKRRENEQNAKITAQRDIIEFGERQIVRLNEIVAEHKKRNNDIMKQFKSHIDVSGEVLTEMNVKFSKASGELDTAKERLKRARAENNNYIKKIDALEEETRRDRIRVAELETANNVQREELIKKGHEFERIKQDYHNKYKEYDDLIAKKNVEANEYLLQIENVTSSLDTMLTTIHQLDFDDIENLKQEYVRIGKTKENIERELILSKQQTGLLEEKVNELAADLISRPTESEYEARMDEIRSLMSDRNGLVAMNEQLRKKVDVFEEKAELLKHYVDISIFDQTVSVAREDFETVVAFRDDLIQKQRTAQEELEAERKKSLQIADMLTSTKEFLSQARAANSTEVKRLQQDNDRLKMEMGHQAEDYEKRLRDLSDFQLASSNTFEDLTTMRERMASLEQDYQKLKIENDMYIDELDDLRSSKTDLTDTISAFIADFSEQHMVTATVDQLKEVIATSSPTPTDPHYVDLTTVLLKHKSDHAEKMADIARRENELHVALSRHEQAKRDMENEHVAARSEYERQIKQEYYDRYESQIKEQSDTIATYQRMINDLTKETDVVMTDTLIRTVGLSEEDTNRLLNENKRLMERVNTLELNIEQGTTALEISENKIATLTNERDNAMRAGPLTTEHEADLLRQINEKDEIIARLSQSNQSETPPSATTTSNFSNQPPQTQMSSSSQREIVERANTNPGFNQNLLFFTETPRDDPPPPSPPRQSQPIQSDDDFRFEPTGPTSSNGRYSSTRYDRNAEQGIAQGSLDEHGEMGRANYIRDENIITPFDHKLGNLKKIHQYTSEPSEDGVKNKYLKKVSNKEGLKYVQLKRKERAFKQWRNWALEKYINLDAYQKEKMRKQFPEMFKYLYDAAIERVEIYTRMAKFVLTPPSTREDIVFMYKAADPKSASPLNKWSLPIINALLGLTGTNLGTSVDIDGNVDRMQRGLVRKMFQRNNSNDPRSVDSNGNRRKLKGTPS